MRTACRNIYVPSAGVGLSANLVCDPWAATWRFSPKLVLLVIVSSAARSSLRRMVVLLLLSGVDSCRCVGRGIICINRNEMATLGANATTLGSSRNNKSQLDHGFVSALSGPSSRMCSLVHFLGVYHKNIVQVFSCFLVGPCCSFGRKNAPKMSLCKLGHHLRDRSK